MDPTPAGLKHLASLKKLASLALVVCGLTDKGLEEVGTLTGLVALNISFSQGTDAGMKQLTGLTNLTSLNLTSNIDLTGRGLKELARLPKLTSLKLDYNTARPKPEDIACLTRLESLHIGGHKVDVTVHGLTGSS